MIRIYNIIQEHLPEYLEEHFCEYDLCNWGIARVDDKSPIELFGYFEDEDEAKNAYATLKESFPDLPENYTVENIQDCDWKNEYKKFLTSWNYKQLHWVPLWQKDTYEYPKEDKILYFDAGLAFGTGDHPTTRLCAMSMLDYVSENDVSKKSIADAGCGSGILAISAKMFGFGEVYAFDRDPEAIRVSQENAEFNEVSGIELSHAGIEKALSDKKFDIMLANIQADVLCIYVDNLINAIKPKGWLVLSGILATQNEKVKELFETKCDYISSKAEFMGDWSSIEIRFK